MRVVVVHMSWHCEKGESFVYEESRKAMATSLSAPGSTSLRFASTDSSKKRSLPPRNGPFLFFRPLPQARFCHSKRRVRVYALASANSSNRSNSLDDLAAHLVEAARTLYQKTGHAFESAWLQTVKLVDSQNFPGKVEQSFSAANRKLEELSYDARKGAQEFDRRFRVSERAQEMGDFATQQVRNVDQQLGLVQKWRNASSDFRRNLPRYRQELDNFLRTPIGRMFSTAAFMWFLLSGWLFRIILLSMWVLPLAAPLLISSAARNTIIEGQCPACRRRYIGNRNQMVVCNYCKAVVWQPRQDFSKGQSDPTIIDVDIN